MAGFLSSKRNEGRREKYGKKNCGTLMLIHGHLISVESLSEA